LGGGGGGRKKKKILMKALPDEKKKKKNLPQKSLEERDKGGIKRVRERGGGKNNG